MNKIFIFVGESGSGKTTIKDIIGKPENTIITSTTRDPRPAEVDGHSYHFLSVEDFNFEDFIEYDYIYGNYYGSSLKEVERKMEKGNCFIVLTHSGYIKFKELYKDKAIGIYVKSSRKDLKRMLDYRREGNVDVRLSDKEAQVDSNDYNYIIINEYGKLEETIKNVKRIVLSNIEDS